MSDHVPQREALLARLKEQLTKAGYCTSAICRQPVVARYFLQFLERQHTSIEVVQPQDVEKYLRCELRRFVRRHGHAPRTGWRASHTTGIRQLLCMVKGRWPTDPPPRSAAEAANRELCGEYVRWLDEQRGLAAGTIRGLVDEARRFLSWYDERFASCDLQALTIADVDAYLKTRAPSLRRVTRKKVALDLRSFLRFAHAAGRVSRDFSSCVTMPMLYAYESIPSVLSPQQIDAVVRTCHGDRSPKGLRDHAIVLLLTTYGLRAGEIARLRLDDVDWRADRLRIRHSKTGSQSMLPLLPTVGAALLAYLRRGRPKTDAREFFVRERAPYCGLTNFYTTLGRRLEAAGVRPAGKRGPHAFRHARAVGLLRSGVPPKIISDVLGHRSPESVRPYLKLATKELRDVALEIRDLVGEDSK